MSAIGDYIHLRQENYVKYGTAMKGQEPQLIAKSYDAQIKRNRERIEQIRDVPRHVLNELESLISNEATQKEAHQIAEGLVTFNQSFNDISKTLENKLLTDVPSKFQSNDYGVRIVKSNVKVNKDLVNIEEAKKARRRIYDNINTINKNMSAGKPVRSSTIETLLKNASDFFNYLGIVNDNLEFIKYRDLTHANTLAALKNIVQLVSLSEMNKAALHGTYGEVLVNMVSDTAKVKAGKAAIEEMKQVLQESGGHRTEFQIDESMITRSVQETFLEDTGINLYQLRATQDKVDASITVKGYDIDASVKAYTPKGNVITAHLQDVSLITSLITTEEQFGNHWLNLHASRMSSAEMDAALKKHIQYEALAAGNLLKKGSAVADTFIVIDAVNGRVYTQSIKEILEKFDNNFIMKPLVEGITINNTFAETWEKRISNILLSLHQQKISVSYKVSLKS